MNDTQRWIDAHAVSFGDVFFEVGKIGGGSFGQWSPEVDMPMKRIPGSNNFFVQNMGRGPSRVTYTLAFGSVDAFHNFTLKLGTSDVLTLPADVSAVQDRNPVVLGGVKYDRLTQTVLESIDPSSVEYFNGGVVRCSATFMRATSDVPIDTLWMETA